ncbi:hypothetical protein Tco_0067389 [Tanacetum coccineum]
MWQELSNWVLKLDFLTNSMNYISVSVENQEYILLPIQPHKTRIPIEDVAPAAHEKPSESSPKDNGVQYSEDAADKEEQHQMKETMDDVSRQAFEEEKRRIASQKKAARATSTNKLSTDRPSVSIASTPTGTNAGESSFVYLGGKIPINASTLPNADLLIDPICADLEWMISTNMDNTIAVSPIPTLRIHKDHLKGQILGDPTSAVQTRGKIQKASSTQQALKNPRLYNKPYKMKAGLKLQKVWVLVDLPYGKKVIGRTASTPIEYNKPLVKDEDGEDVDVHVYRSMIGSLMYLTASRQDIMFDVCACARFQVTPKASHLNAVKRIFKYLKHQPKLGLWYPRDSPFELEAFSDSDYGGASLDRKSTTVGCQFL